MPRKWGRPVRVMPLNATEPRNIILHLRPSGSGIRTISDNPIETLKDNTMSEIRMTGELRTDYDCETTGLPAERWAEAVFKIGDEELVFEVSVEKKCYRRHYGGGRRRLEGHP